jgi:hypothetical protein
MWFLPGPAAVSFFFCGFFTFIRVKKNLPGPAAYGGRMLSPSLGHPTPRLAQTQLCLQATGSAA